MKFKKVPLALLASVLALSACTTSPVIEEESSNYETILPSGDLILGSQLDACGRIDSQPYPLNAYFENHPYNEDNYRYYVYRTDDFLDAQYWFGTASNVSASLKLPADLDPGDEIRIDWINETYPIVELEDGTEEFTEVDVVAKSHTVLSPLPCEDGNTYVSSEFNFTDFELSGPFPYFRVEFSYNDHLEYVEKFSLDGVQ